MNNNNKISNILNFFISELTAFGIPNIIKRKNKYSKIFWIIFVVLGTTSSVFYTFEALNDYFEYATISKIEYLYQQPLRFPTITICSETGQTFSKNRNLRNLISNCEVKRDSACLQNPELFFESIKLNSMGDCIRFNSGKNMNASSIAFVFSTMGGRDDYFEIEFRKSFAIRLFIHESDLPPQLELSNIYETYIQLNESQTYIALDKIIESKLGLPYNNCYKNVSEFHLNKTLIDYIQSLNQRYAQVNCLKLCFELNYIENDPCNCSINTTLGNVWSDCFINFDKKNIKGCTMKYKINFTQSSVVEKCSQYCPLECDSTFYTYSFSLINVQKTNLFRIFYNSLKVATITQKAKSRDCDLVSTIGGIFGLFIGVSFVSFFEISEIFIEIFLTLFHGKYNKNKIQNSKKRINHTFENHQNIKLKAEIINEIKNLLKIEIDSYFKNQTQVTEEIQS